MSGVRQILSVKLPAGSRRIPEADVGEADLTEMDYSLISKAMGCHGIRVSDPAKLAGAIGEGLANTSSPTVIDVVVTRDPGRSCRASITAR